MVYGSQCRAICGRRSLMSSPSCEFSTVTSAAKRKRARNGKHIPYPVAYDLIK